MLQSLSLLDFLVLVLATYATAHYVTREDGPGAVFLRLRQWAGAEVPADDVAVLGDEAVDTEPPVPRSRFLAELLSCPYCLSPYAAVATLLLLYVAWPVAWILAAAGGSVLLLEMTRP